MIPRKLRINLKIVMLYIPLFLLFSCQNERHWYPEAEVSVSGIAEYTDQSNAKGLAVTLVIRNTSDTTIVSSTVTVI
jgi:hypothetical protein